MIDMKKRIVLLAGSLVFAAGFAWADGPTVVGSSELTGQVLDTRVVDVRTIASVDDILPFAFIDGMTITVTRAGEGSTETFQGTVDATTVWSPSGSGFYTATNGSLSAAFDIPPLVCDFAFDAGETYEWQKDTEQRPAFTLKDGDYTLQEGIDFTAVYSDNVNPGTATLTITGLGRYRTMGTVVKTFTIRPASVAHDELASLALDTRPDPVREVERPSDILPFVFIDGETITVTRASDASTVTLEGTVETTTAWSPSGSGLFAATNGTLSAAFHITPIVCDFAFVAGDTYEWQKDTEQRPAFTLTDGDYTLQENIDFTVVYSDNVNPGTATLTITGKGSYLAMDTIIQTFTIRPASVAHDELTNLALDTRPDPVREVVRLSDILPFVFFDGETITVTRARDAATETFQGTVETTTVWSPGGSGLFAATNGTLSAAFHIAALVCDFAFVEGDAYDWQNGTELRPAFTLTDGDYTLQEGIDFTAVYSDNVDPGTATLMITGLGPYLTMGTIVKTFTIRPGSVAHDELTNLALDTRTNEVRVVQNVADILPIAWNNAMDWPQGGAGADAVRVVFQPMAGANPADPTGWTSAGESYTVVSASGEGTNGVQNLATTLYKATLIDGEAVRETAYFDLTCNGGAWVKADSLVIEAIDPTLADGKWAVRISLTLKASETVPDFESWLVETVKRGKIKLVYAETAEALATQGTEVAASNIRACGDGWATVDIAIPSCLLTHFKIVIEN